MKITAIKAQVKRADRVSVFVDGKYALSLNYSQVLDQKIRTGLEVDNAKLAELKQCSDFGKAYERALNYVTLRPRSEREVRDYARKKQWSPADTEVIVSKLRTRNYINDSNFARAWVESRMAGKKTSARKLKLELKQKGVAEDIIKNALDNAEFADSDALSSLISKKLRLAKYAADPQKLMLYLVRQGFGYDDVKNALQQSISKID